MPFKLEPPVKKTYVLIELDGEEKTDTPTTLTIRQATQGDVIARNDLFSVFERTYGAEVTVKQRISFDDIRRLEVFLTMAECNILGEDDKPLFKFENGRLRNKTEFEKAWAILPPYVADIIQAKVLEINKMWSAEGEPSNMGE